MLSLFNFTENQEHIIVDLPNKPGNIIKIAGTTNDPYFCGKDVCAILEYENTKQAIQLNVDVEDKKSLLELLNNPIEHKIYDVRIGKVYDKLSYNDGKAVYINTKGLTQIIQKSRNTDLQTKQILIDKLSLNLNLVLPCKETVTISDIIRAFPCIRCIKQHVVGPYKVDIYFPKFKIAIECDEFGHKDRALSYELERQKFIEESLKCEFVRYNPDEKDFNVLDVIGRINTIIFKNENLLEE